MDGAEREEFLREAKQHERAHRLTEAVECYLMGQGYADAARLLSHLGCFYEAGLTLLLHLPPGETNVLLLNSDLRRVCMDASTCFARAGARPEMIALLTTLGERQRAASLLMRAGLRKRATAVIRGEASADSPWRPGVIGPLATQLGVLRRVQAMALRSDPDYQVCVPLPDGPRSRPKTPRDPTPIPEYKPEPAEPEPPSDPPVEQTDGGLRGWRAALPWVRKKKRAEEKPAAPPRARESGARQVPPASRSSGPREVPTRSLTPEPIPPTLDTPPPTPPPAPVARSRRMEDMETMVPSAMPSRYRPAVKIKPPRTPAEDPDLESVTPDEDLQPTNKESLFIEPGTILRDRFRIEDPIGAGGMATVFKAWDLEMEEPVALKIFLSVVANPSLLRRFRREMKIHRRLQHPNIVRTYEFGIFRGARFISMELLEGQELWRFVHDEQPSPARVLQLMIDACDGLTYAHDMGIVHRDIKPSNLFVVDGGNALKLMDFGIAKATDSSQISVTGVRVGTPRYMSPEQIQAGGSVGPAADLYALGAVMYEAFTGRPVFEDSDLLPLLLNHLTEEPEPPSTHRPELTPEIDLICLKLLQKEPADRYPDAASLKVALESALETIRTEKVVFTSPGGRVRD